MNALYHHGIITPFPTTQVESYMELYGFRMTEQHDDLFTLIRDPVPLELSGSSCLTWNLDHYPATHEGTRQLERDLTQWGVSEHNRMVLLLTHQERYGVVVAYWWRHEVPAHPTGDASVPRTPSPLEIG